VKVGETRLRAEEGVQMAVVLARMSYCEKDRSDLDLDVSLGGVGWFAGGLIPFPIDCFDLIG
jgi:hypothetical protein